MTKDLLTKDLVTTRAHLTEQIRVARQQLADLVAVRPQTPGERIAHTRELRRCEGYLSDLEGVLGRYDREIAEAKAQ